MVKEKQVTVWSVQLMLVSVLVPRCSCARSEFSNPDGKERVIPALEALVTGWGYPIETYSVTTEDGYILTVFRLPRPFSTKSSVYLQHGIMSSCATFLANRRGIPYHLFDKGYDVWVGNARGTQFSQQHKEFSTYNKKFWDFSFHEMGFYDIPAVLRFIRDTTGKPRAHYVGHSMGTTMFLVTATCRPDIVELVHSVTFLAPVARPMHMEMIEAPFKRKFIHLGTKILPIFGISYYKYKTWIGPLLHRFCKPSSNSWFGKWCRSLITGTEDKYDYVSFEELSLPIHCQL